MKNLCLVSLLFTVIAISLNCSPTQKSDNITKDIFDEASIDLQHVCTADSLVLAWDSPESDPADTTNDTIVSYKLHYKTAKQQAWVLINDTIPAADSPQCVIPRSMVSGTDSTFWFAVKAVTKNENISDFHGSEDSTASPTNWFVLWKKK